MGLEKDVRALLRGEAHIFEVDGVEYVFMRYRNGKVKYQSCEDYFEEYVSTVDEVRLPLKGWILRRRGERYHLTHTALSVRYPIIGEVLYLTDRQRAMPKASLKQLTLYKGGEKA